VKTIRYLVMAALVAMLILAPAALAQDVVEGKTTFWQQNGKRRC
jgi:hypothetical protein